MIDYIGEQGLPTATNTNTHVVSKTFRCTFITGNFETLKHPFCNVAFKSSTPPISNPHRVLLTKADTSSYINPLDPNPAISAHAVFPQSGHIRPEKRPFFQNFPQFFQIRTSKKVLTEHRGAIYQIKASKSPCKTQRRLFRFDRYMCVGKTLNMDSCSKFWGNLQGNLGKSWGNTAYWMEDPQGL